MSDLKEVFDALQREVIGLHANWSLYRQLYGSSGSRVELLNRVASGFFSRLQWIMLDDVVMSICRLLDPMAIGRRKNLVLESMLAAIPQGCMVVARRALSDRLLVLAGITEGFRKRRNRALAHLDLAHLLDPGSDPIPGISRESVERALKEIRSCMDCVQEQLSGGVMAYDLVVMTADGNALVHALKQAVEYRLLEDEGIVSPLRVLHESEYRDA